MGEETKLAALRRVNPSKLLDSVEVVELFNDRFALHSALASLDVCCESGRVATPPSCEWRRPQKDDAAAVAISNPFFPPPWICKPRTADGTRASHELFMVYDASLLEQSLTKGEAEWQIQPFVVHGGVLCKIYVLGDLISQQCRPSLPDSMAQGEGVVALARQQNHRKISDTPIVMEDELLRDLVREVRRRLGGATLFGMDVLRSESGEYMLVDVNYFPGFYGVSDVFARVAGMALDKLQRRGLSPMSSPGLLTGRVQVEEEEHAVVEELEESGLLTVARIADLFGYLLGFVRLHDFGALARSCRSLYVACNSRAAWLSVVRRFGARLDRLPGFSRHPRRVALESVLPPCWATTGTRTATLGGGHIVAGRLIGAHELGTASFSVRFSNIRCAFVGVGLSCGGETTRSLWLPPNGMPCLVLGSGFWQKGSRLALPSGVVVPPPPPCVEGSFLVVSLRLSPGRIHFFVQREYIASFALPITSKGSWRFAVGGASGSAVVLLDEQIPPVPEHQRLLL